MTIEELDYRIPKEFNHSHQEGVSDHTSSLSPEDKEPDAALAGEPSGSEFNLSERRFKAKCPQRVLVDRNIDFGKELI